MTLLLNDEQKMLKAAARDFFSARLPVATLRRLRDADDADGFDRAAWREMAGLGWAGVLVPEAWGGSDFGYTGLGQVLEEAGRTLAASPLVSTALIAAPLLVACGSEAQKNALLPTLVAGERLCALALDEGPQHAPATIALRASRDGKDWVLDGTKAFVLDGSVADDLVVVARSAGTPGDEHGLALFLVPASAPGLTRTRMRMVDSRNAARLVFDGVRVEPEALLGAADTAFAKLDRVLDGARAGLAAEMLGGTLEAFERTLNYLKFRCQFGVPIGSFQALKHRAAQMFCEIELTRSAVLAALAALDAGDAAASLLASLAKAKACETFELVSSEAVQMHGGIGMTDAEEIGFFLKRARVAQQAFGDASFHRQRYARLRGF
jgi:alkylation response protein AidB-like acyl-CoA dehydrogenase